MRRVAAVVLAALMAGPPPVLWSAPALGMIQGFVTIEGRPVQGVEVALIDLQSGEVRRVTSTLAGAFQAQVSPGRYVVTTENKAGLAVGRAPVVIPVGAGQVASTRIDLLALPVPLAQEPPPPPPLPPPGDAQSSTSPAQSGAPVINHDAVGCFIAGEFPMLDSGIEPASSVARARVYFKSKLGTSYYYVEMSQGEGKFWGKLPRPRIEASPLYYYIQATSTEFGESQTPEIEAIVVKEAKDCPGDRKVAAIGPAGPVQVFSAVSGAAISPAGFAAGGLAIAGGALALIIGGAAAAGIVAAVTVFNPSPAPPPTTTTLAPPPVTRPPAPRPSPSPSPTPFPVGSPCVPVLSPPKTCP